MPIVEVWPLTAYKITFFLGLESGSSSEEVLFLDLDPSNPWQFMTYNLQLQFQTPSSGLRGHQAYMWYTQIYAEK